jgi:hypothetical protein
MDKPKDTITFTYRFTFPDGKVEYFPVALNAKDLTLVGPQLKSTPEWTRLGFHKCPECPLNELHDHDCPTAVSMLSLINFCKDLESCQQVTVIVETAQRNYIKKTSLQSGLSSLAGIYMAAGGCPVLAKLRPLVRFHLPFADNNETSYRVFSMYILAQYFLAKRGKEADWTMAKLADTYRQIAKVNRAFCARLREVVTNDAGLNAVIALDAFALFIQTNLDINNTQDLENIFSAYLE